MSKPAAFRAAHASAATWQDAVGRVVVGLGNLTQEYRLGFVYITEHFAGDLEEIEIFLRQTTGVQSWVGAVGTGVCGMSTEYFDVPAISAMVVPIGEDGFRIFRDVTTGAEQVVAQNREWLATADPPLAVVHADPVNRNLQALATEFSAASNAYLVGGLTVASDTSTQLAGGATGGGLSGVLLSPHALPVAVGLTQGCSPIGPAHTVTRAEGNILIELDEQPALEVFSDDIGASLGSDLRRAGGYIFAALTVSGSDTGDYLVRNLMGIDRENGLVAIGDMVSTGDRVMFCRRDSETAVADLRRMLERLKSRTGGGIRGGLYHTCVARGPNQFGPDSRELKIISEVLGDFPIAGMFANGEINHSRLYGYTGVLTLFL